MLRSYQASQRWHHALVLAETPRHAPDWIQRFRCSWGLLQTRDSRTERCSSAWIRSSRLKTVVPNPQATKNALEKCKDHVDTTGTFGTNRTSFIASFLCGRINFCWHQYKRRNQAVKDPLPWVEFKLSFGRVLVTPVLWWTLSGVELSKTLSTSRRKFTIGRLTSSILNPSSLILTGPQKSPTSFDFFRERLKSWPRGNNARGS